MRKDLIQWGADPVIPNELDVAEQILNNSPTIRRDVKGKKAKTQKHDGKATKLLKRCRSMPDDIQRWCMGYIIIWDGVTLL